MTLTDVDTALPGQSFQYETAHRRLMLWILEVSLRYLESADFDQDTVMVSPDILVLGDLRPFFTADLGVIVRSADKFIASERPLLNSVQWWRVGAKDRLADFYRQALEIAETLPEDVIRWGADTEPLLRLLSPLQVGQFERVGLTVSAMDQREVMGTFSRRILRHMQAGQPYQGQPLLDFKYLRKRHMREFFEFAIEGVPCRNS
ncbi:MAG TPA: hypothetical protein VF491_17520 [Vicinamibacterales bacterium]